MSTQPLTTEYVPPLVRIYPPSVLLEDAPVHCPPYYFCRDETCPCHSEGLWLARVACEYRAGLLTTEEALRIISHQQVNS